MGERPIIVTTHAVETFRSRKQDKRPFRVVAAEIERCVEAGLEAGYVHAKRPRGFVLYGRKPTMFPPGQRFVQCDPDSNYGFIIKRSPDEGDIVLTTLTKAGVR